MRYLINSLKKARPSEIRSMEEAINNNILIDSNYSKEEWLKAISIAKREMNERKSIRGWYRPSGIVRSRIA